MKKTLLDVREGDVAMGKTGGGSANERKTNTKVPLTRKV